MIVFDPLWKTMKKKHISQYKLDQRIWLQHWSAEPFKKQQLRFHPIRLLYCVPSWIVLSQILWNIGQTMT